MLTPNLMLLYVENTEKSALFYAKLLAQTPSVVLPTYAAFEFENGLALALWSVRAKDFVSGGLGHRSEIALMVSEPETVRALYERWQADAVTIEQPLHEAVFGLTFVALDPDGHRIRVCLPDG